MDHFGGGFIIFILATLEVVAIQWVYGIKNFCDDLEFMIGQRPNYYWKFCWAVFIPLALMAIFIYSVVTMKPLKYGKIEYPESAMSEYSVTLERTIVDWNISMVQCS